MLEQGVFRGILRGHCSGQRVKTGEEPEPEQAQGEAVWAPCQKAVLGGRDVAIHSEPSTVPKRGISLLGLDPSASHRKAHDNEESA